MRREIRSGQRRDAAKGNEPAASASPSNTRTHTPTRPEPKRERALVGHRNDATPKHQEHQQNDTHPLPPICVQRRTLLPGCRKPNHALCRVRPPPRTPHTHTHSHRLRFTPFSAPARFTDCRSHWIKFCGGAVIHPQTRKFHCPHPPRPRTRRALDPPLTRGRSRCPRGGSGPWAWARGRRGHRRGWW